MEFYTRVIVRDDPYTGTGEVLHEETIPLDISGVSLDELVAAASGFGWDVLELTDWYSTSLRYNATASGGDSESVVIVFEALQNLKGIAGPASGRCSSRTC